MKKTMLLPEQKTWQTTKGSQNCLCLSVTDSVAELGDFYAASVLPSQKFQLRLQLEPFSSYVFEKLISFAYF
jgi:hypothetical protein